MAAMDFYSHQEAGNEENTLLLDPFEEEEEEALSLCDLPIYSGSISDQWSGDSFSKEDGKNSRYKDDGDDDNDDFFEFFSEEYFTTSSSTGTTTENIIFCGKLIPFKDSSHVESNTTSSSTKHSSVQKGSAIVPWRPINKAKPSLKKEHEIEAKGSKSFACDYTSIGNVSLLRSTTKSRWFLFMFGMSKLSTTEMELRDIRNRQSRRGPSTMFPAPEKEVKGRRNCKRMWKMLKSMSMVLGCSSSKIANDVVKAAFV